MQPIAIINATLQEAVDLFCHGEFGTAIDCLGEQWPGVGLRPTRNGLDDYTFAKLLLACGVLTMKQGVRSLQQTGDAARNLLSESERLFGTHPDAIAARLWVGVSYIDEGRFPEAIAWADSILAEQNADLEITFMATLTRAIAEMRLGDPAKALETLTSVELFADEVKPLTHGKYCLQTGVCLRKLGRTEEALEAYGSAEESFVEAHSPRFAAIVMNNIAWVYLHQGLYARARAVARKALKRIQALKDRGFEAQLWDTQAQIYLAEQDYGQAFTSAQRAVELLDGSDQQGWLADALLTLGQAAAGLSVSHAIPSLLRAVAIFEQLDNQHKRDEANAKLWQAVRAGKELSRRICSCTDPIESRIIEDTLEKHDGAVTSTARELGFSHHGLLTSRIKALKLDEKRTAPVRRKRSIIRKPLQDS